MEIELINIKKLEKYLTEKNLCLIIGPKYLIDEFCKDKGIQVDYIMGGGIKPKPVNVYSVATKEDFLFGLTNKDSIIGNIPIGMKFNKERLFGVKVVKKMWEDGCKKTVEIMDDTSEIILLSYIQDYIEYYRTIGKG